MEDIPEIPPSRNNDEELSLQLIFERNPEALIQKNKFKNALNDPSFNPETIKKFTENWDTKMAKKKGYSGQYSEIEELTGIHGKIKVIHYRNPDIVRFVFSSN